MQPLYEWPCSPPLAPSVHVRKHHSFAFQTPFANTDVFKSSFFLSFFFSVFILVLRPVEIISLILSRVIRKVGSKREIRDKNHLTTRKQNLACLTCGPSWARTHSGEMANDLERWILTSLTIRSRGPPNVAPTPRLFEIGILLQIFLFLLLKVQKTVAKFTSLVRARD